MDDFCPICGCPNFSADSFHVEGDSAVRECTCVECGSNWQEVWKRTSIDDIHDTTKDDSVERAERNLADVSYANDLRGFSDGPDW